MSEEIFQKNKEMLISAFELLELLYNMCPMDEDMEKQVRAWLDDYDALEIGGNNESN